MSRWASPAGRSRPPRSAHPQLGGGASRGPGPRGPAPQARPAPSRLRTDSAAPPGLRLRLGAVRGGMFWGGGGPDDGIRARRAGAGSPTAARGDGVHSQAGGCGPEAGWGPRTGLGGGGTLPALAWARRPWGPARLRSPGRARGAPTLASRPPGGPSGSGREPPSLSRGPAAGVAGQEERAPTLRGSSPHS